MRMTFHALMREPRGLREKGGWTRRNTPTTVNPAHVVSIEVFERGTYNGGDVWDIVLSNGSHYKVGDADAMNAADEIEGVE